MNEASSTIPWLRDPGYSIDRKSSMMAKKMKSEGYSETSPIAMTSTSIIEGEGDNANIRSHDST